MSDGSVGRSESTVLYASAAGADAAPPEKLSAIDEALTVVTETTLQSATDAALERSVDCVVTARELSTGTGIELLQAIRRERPALPVVLYAEDGSEAIASEAIAAGVTDYVSQSRPDSLSQLVDAIRRATDDYEGPRHPESERGVARADGEPVERAVSNAGHGIIVTDASGRIEYVNPVFERLSGYSVDEAVGRTPRIVNSGAHDEDFFDDLWNTIRAGEVWQDEVVNRRKDGELYVVDKTITPIADGGEITGFVGVSAEVSERAGYETAVEASRDGVAVLNRDLEFVLANDAFVLLTGIPSDWLLDQDLSSFVESSIVDKETYRRLFEQLKAVISGDTTEHRRDISFLSPVMGEIVVDVRMTPAGDAHPIDGAVVSLRNITQRKAHEADLENKNERLETFTGTISHDLRNPLNVAVSNLELARETCELDSLETVAGAHDRMDELIDDFLALSRDGDLIGTTSSVSLATTARAAWSNVESYDSTLDVVTDARIRADDARLRQLFENLFRNAIEHGSAREPGADACDGVTISVGSLDGGVYVADDGRGIPAAERDTVFETGHTTSVKGTGLGLTIVDRIVAGHGWSVTVTESESGGARFEFTGIDPADS